MFKTLQHLILASESPRRKLMLQSAGVEFLVEPSRIDEPGGGATAGVATAFGGGDSACDPAASRRPAAKTSTLILAGAPSASGAAEGLSAHPGRRSHRPPEIAESCAFLKADSISALHRDSWVLGADTIVVCDGHIFGKPSDDAHAAGMLQALSGRLHEVITGMCLIRPGGKLRRSDSVTTQVRFKDLSMKEIEAYVRTGEPMDKAGAYGIQGIGAFLVRSLEGSYTNVVGLPLCQTIEWLMNENIIEPG